MLTLPGLCYKWLGWDSDEFHLVFKQFLFVVSWKEGLSCEKFSDDATKRPNVDFRTIRYSQHYFRSTVKSTLNISVGLFACFASRTKINDLEIFCLFVAKQNIFWFQVTVDYLSLLQELQCLQNLPSVIFNNWNVEALVLLVLDMLEQVFIQEFKDEYLMIAPPEVLQHPNYVVLVIRILLH